MGQAAFEHERAFLEQDLPAAVILCRTPQGGLHLGLVYRVDEDAAFLHLAWNDVLSNEWTWTHLWAFPPVKSSRIRTISRLCRQIWMRYRQNRRFAYALAYQGTVFDVSGGIVLGSGAVGLTCATFVLAVFKSFGIDLVDETTWLVRTDEDRAFIESLREFMTDDHYRILSDEVDSGCRRIRPEEVLGACTCSELPASFAPTRAAADEILTRL